MSKPIYECIDKYVVYAACVGPMHVGGTDEKSEVLIHPITGVPFIQATSICGALRDYYSQITGENPNSVKRLFGDTSNTSESRIRFTDGVFDPDPDLRLELRPRICLDNESGTAGTKQVSGLSDTKSGQKFDMQYVGSGAKFHFEIFLYDSTEEESVMLQTALAALHAGEIQFGGQKSNGCGYIEIQDLQFRHYDMRQPLDRKAWIQESESDLKSIELPKIERTLHSDIYEIEVMASTEGELLVKGIAVEKFGKDEPKAVNLKDARGRFIIPGSSVKGAIRNRMEMIADYLGKDESLIFEGFGRSSESESEGIRGNLRFRDVVVGNENGEDCALRTRIHIDKLTGGVMNGALFSELNVYGDLKLCMNVSDRRNAKAVTGLLMLALRDLAYKMYALGSGQSVGKGYLDVKEIRIRDLQQGKECILNHAFEAAGDRAILDQCMAALRETR
ncbi:MAG: RAMP superfamily CRISPR-associated protein [Clostridiaceae bacterium]|nr:RAMP superfamily CRISPR-associated protein [Clostridiaceae bacterium]